MASAHQLISEWIDSIARFEQARAELVASRLDELEALPWESSEYASCYQSWRAGEQTLGSTRGRLFHLMLSRRIRDGWENP